MRYSIKEIEKLTGIKAHTIRMWEKRYGLIKPHRTESNIRYYDEDQLKEFLNIAILISKNHKISSIVNLSKDELVNKTQQITEEENASFIDSVYLDEVNKLIVAMLDLNEQEFENAFHTSLLRRGFKNTLINVICPFVDKLELLWQTTDITYAHQNFILNKIRLKTSIAIDSLECENECVKKFLLFLPKYEYSDHVMIMIEYLIKSSGYKVLNIGQNINNESLKKIVKQETPDYILTHAHVPKAVNQLIEMFSSNIGLFMDKEIWIYGQRGLLSSLYKFRNLSILENLKELNNQFKQIS